MNRKSFFAASFVLIFILIACSFKQKERPIDPKLLPGKYCDNIDGRDSIFIYDNNSYKHTFHRKDGTIDSQTGTWYFKAAINDIFFDEFIFFNDGGPEYFKGTWPPKVFLTEEGQVKLQYSESVYYVKEPTK